MFEVYFFVIFGRFLSQIGPKLIMTLDITLIVYLEGTNKYPKSSRRNEWVRFIDALGPNGHVTYPYVNFLFVHTPKDLLIVAPPNKA